MQPARQGRARQQAVPAVVQLFVPAPVVTGRMSEDTCPRNKFSTTRDHLYIAAFEPHSFTVLMAVR